MSSSTAFMLEVHRQCPTRAWTCSYSRMHLAGVPALQPALPSLVRQASRIMSSTSDAHLQEDNDGDRSSSKGRTKARPSPVYKPRRLQRVVDPRMAAPEPAHAMVHTADSQPPFDSKGQAPTASASAPRAGSAPPSGMPSRQFSTQQILPSHPARQRTITAQSLKGRSTDHDQADVVTRSASAHAAESDDADDGDNLVMHVPSTAGRTKSAPAVDLTGDVFFAPGNFVELGHIVGAHGIRGEVKIELATDNPKKRLGAAGNLLLLQPPQAKGLLARSQTLAVPLLKMTTAGAKIRVLSKGVEAWIVTFKELSNRAEAEQLRGYTILMPLSARERLKDPDEFYAQDLVGCAAYDQASGVRIGTITDLFSGTGTFDTLSVQLRSTADDLRDSKIRTTLVPFVADICPVVDVTAKRVELSAPDGLLNLFSTRKMRKALTPGQQAERLKALQEELKAEAALIPTKPLQSTTVTQLTRM